MPDLLEQGLNWLDDQRDAHMTRSVTYERGAESVALNATIGRTQFEQVDRDGIVQRLEARDYLLRAAELVLAGQETLPKAGDRIKETDAGGVIFTCEVMPMGSEPPWRYSDPFRRTLRIHTKLVSREAP